MTLVNEDSQEQTVQPLTRIEEVYDVIIVGGGVAGLSAAVYAARDGFKTLVLEGEYVSSVDYPGGALMLTPDIENYPGFMKGEGMELVAAIRSQAEHFGAEFVEERACAYSFSSQAGASHTIETATTTYETKSIILAMGATAKLLDVPGELDFYGKGVSTCATCDGFFFKNKNVAVVGGGDTAVEDALFLTRYSDKVYLIVRSDTLKAAGPQAKEILTHPQVEIVWNTTVDEIFGVDNVTQVALDSSGVKSVLDVDGIFVAIGRTPATATLVDSGVSLDSEGYLLVRNDSTAVEGVTEGVFAAGDVVDKIYRQAITSAGKGAQSALEARHYLLAHPTK